MEWKKVRQGKTSATFAAVLPGGLLLKEVHKDEGRDISGVALAFVPGVTLSMVDTIIALPTQSARASGGPGVEALLDALGGGRK